MPAKRKPARKVRTVDEFASRNLFAGLSSVSPQIPPYSWSIAECLAARDAQIQGQMRLPALLATSFRTDDALFAAWSNRLAPSRGLAVVLRPANGTTRALAVAREAEGLFGARGVAVTPATVADLNSDLADHGFAVGFNRWVPRADGSRVDVQHLCWPMHSVCWNDAERRLETQLQDGTTMPIEHGDGRWAVYAKHEQTPWARNAAVIPGSLVWAARAYASRAWSAGADGAGHGKTLGELPEGTPIQDEDGNLTLEAKHLVELLRQIASVENPIGIVPAGGKVSRLVDTGQAWQVFAELLKAKDRAANMIYLGQDVAKATGGSQRLSLEQLYGIRDDIVSGDLEALTEGVLTGVIEPWAALNYGDSTLAPVRAYDYPDADEDARKAAVAEQHKAFLERVSAYRSAGFLVTQETVDRIAADFRLPAIPPLATIAPAMPLASTDIARVIRVNEARASLGLGPLVLADGSPDPAGDLTVESYSARNARGPSA